MYVNKPRDHEIKIYLYRIKILRLMGKTLEIVTDKLEWGLTANDRCDHNCASQAYVKAVGISGELLFCAHHYNKILSDSKAFARLEQFAYKITDERGRLIENRLQGSN